MSGNSGRCLHVVLGVAFLMSCKSDSEKTDSRISTKDQGIDGSSDTMHIDDAGTKYFTKKIGEEGGELATDDDLFRLIVPPGALSSSTEISIAVHGPTKLTAEGLVTPAIYELSPAGTTFDMPVAISIAQKESPPADQHLGVGLYDEGSKQWSEVVGSTLHTDRVVAMVDHFSYYGAFYYQGQPVYPITQVKVEPATLMATQPAQNWWSRWEAHTRTLTVTGRTSPDGQGSWHDSKSGTSGTFTISGGVFSFQLPVGPLGFTFPVLRTEAGSGYWLEVWCGQQCPPPVDAGPPKPDVTVDSGIPAPTKKAIWSKRFNGSDDVEVYDIARCPTTGDLWITGTTRGSIDFGAGGVVTANSAYGDAFVARFDADGNHLFSRNYFSKTKSGIGRGRGIVCDPSGNVVVVGTCQPGIDFTTDDSRPLPGIAFIAMLDQGGAHLASNGYEYTAFFDIDRDPASGDVFITGSAGHLADFGFGQMGVNGMLFARFNSAAPVYAKNWEGSGAGLRIVVGNGGNVWMAGYFAGTLNLGGNDLNSNGGNDAFLVHLAGSDGSHLASTSSGTNNDDSPYAMAVHPGTTDSVYLGVDNYNGFTLEKYDHSATKGWNKHLGTLIEDRLMGLTCDSAGNVIATGSQRSQIDFGSGPVSTPAMALYVVKYDSTGQYSWGQTYSAVGTSEGAALITDPTDYILALGTLKTMSIDFGNGPLIHTSIHQSPVLFKLAP